MQTLTQFLQSQFLQALLSAYPDKIWQATEIEITPSTQAQFGHYQCNSAMKLAKVLGKAPREIAKSLVDVLDKSGLHKVEIAGPGFINISFDAGFLAARVQAMLVDDHLGVPQQQVHEKVVVDFSSPNTAKEMHVGHLRSSIIGDALARIFEFLGYKVLRLNHVGDWGTAFGMLIAHMKDRAKDVLAGQKSTDLSHLVAWYKESKQRFDEDEAFKKQAQLEVVALQSGETEALKAWGIICDISRKAYQEIYDLLDISIVERGESFYNPMLPGIIKLLEDKGLMQVDDGAKCVFPPGFVGRDDKPQPLIVQKSDGGFNYASTDLAALNHRVNVEKAHRIMILTDAGQASHFAMVFKVGEMAGFYDPAKVRLDHVPFGLVLGPDGKKFKTRSGDTEKLIDLLTAGVAHAGKILAERYGNDSQLNIDEMAKVLGINAIKYADLSCNRIHDYSFSYERMLKFEGNTAAFINYAYVRTVSIKRKVGAEAVKSQSIILLHPSELALALTLNQFAEVLNTIANDLLPNRLTEYLYNLADKFNAFFRDCRVEGDANQNSRLLLCEITGKVLKAGMNLLGLKVLEKM